MNESQYKAAIEILEAVEKRTGMSKQKICKFSTQKFERAALAEKLEALSKLPEEFWRKVNEQFNLF